MVHEHDREKFRALLVNKRNQVLQYRNRLGEAWRDLHEREPEMEERAQNEFMSRNAESLDEQELAVLEAADEALRRLETGSYGVCMRCGERIPDERLEAVPWTPWCVTCAGEAERSAGSADWTSEELAARNLDRDVERTDRAAGKVKVPGKTEKDVLLQGAEDEEETHEAMVEGTSTLSSDRFVPERED